jgi:hypothetical protein
MNGKDFVEALDEFDVRLTPATKCQWSSKPNLSRTIVRNALRYVRSQALTAAIKPIVEFHPLKFDHDKATDSFANRIAKKKVVDDLKEHVGGIYCFYDASGKIVYIGKTEKNTLFSEMQQRYKGKDVEVKLLVRGRAAKPKHKISDLAQYISAYFVDQHLISDIEALLTRVVINNAANLKVESFGRKKSLRAGGQ